MFLSQACRAPIGHSKRQPSMLLTFERTTENLNQRFIRIWLLQMKCRPVLCPGRSSVSRGNHHGKPRPALVQHCVHNRAIHVRQAKIEHYDVGIAPRDGPLNLSAGTDDSDFDPIEPEEISETLR